MSRPFTSTLTQRQQQILDWIKGFIRDHGMPPTVREIGDAFAMKSSSALQHLQVLERKGRLKRGSRGARDLIVKGAKRIPCACERVPVLGRIAAGRPVEAIEHDAGTLHVEKDLLRGHGGYALKVVGDSMVEAGILDGDYVVIRKQETAEDGDVVVALIEGEATLKRFHREKGRIRVAEQRVTEVRDQIIRLGRELVDTREVAQACSLFEPVWETLAPREQARILHLLIERVDYDGENGNVSITFHQTGIKTLSDELSEEVAACPDV